MKEFKEKLKPFNNNFKDEFPFVCDYNMIRFFDTEVTVIKELHDSCVMIKEDDGEYMWLWDWFEK